jgi:hypothetical protein
VMHDGPAANASLLLKQAQALLVSDREILAAAARLVAVKGSTRKMYQ